jgi:predicted transposase YbfD/YdcC
MSDYFLNKIYDSLLSNKPVPKKPEPIVEKKKEAKTLQESYQLMYKKDTDPEFTKIEVDDVQFQKAYRYLQVTNTELQDAIKELRMSGLVQHHIQMIERLVFAHDNPKNFYNAIKNKVTIEELLQHADMVTFISNRYNLSREIVADLLSFVPPGTPSLGKGEVFFILFVQGAKKGKKVDEEASQSGDVVIGNNRCSY